MISRKFASLLFAVALLPLSSAMGDIEWQNEYPLSRLPSEQTRRWVKVGGGKTMVDGPILLIGDGDEKTVFWKFRGAENDTEWNPSTPTTVEFRAEFDGSASPTGDCAVMTLADGKNYYPFFFKTAAMKTYRILLQDGVATLWVEDEPVAIATSNGSPIRDQLDPRFLYFGNASLRTQGVSRWELIRWTHKGAFPFSQQ